jgi:hypothetical protein
LRRRPPSPQVRPPAGAPPATAKPSVAAPFSLSPCSFPFLFSLQAGAPAPGVCKLVEESRVASDSRSSPWWRW